MLPTILFVYAMNLCSAVRTTLLYALLAARILSGFPLTALMWYLTEPPRDVTRARILWHLITFPIVQGILGFGLFYILIKYDPYWQYINHQWFLHLAWYVGGHLIAQFAIDELCVHPKIFRTDPVTGQLPTCWQKVREYVLKISSYGIGNVSLALLLLLASIARYDLLHALASNVLMRRLIVGGGMLLQFVLSKFMPVVMIAIFPKPADDETPVRLARAQEVFSYYCAYVSLFASKLLVTALQGPVEAWCFSLLSAVLEVADTFYSFWSAARKLSRLRAEVPPTDLKEAEASENEEKKAAETTALRQTIVLLAIRYLTIMMLEYVATATAVLLAVMFEGNNLVTGLSAGYWTARTGLFFLLAQFVPELMSDVLGLAILAMFGVKIRELFVAIHCSAAVLAIKAVISPYILPLVILCAMHRKWGI